jgi:4Fe-4S binding domain
MLSTVSERTLHTVRWVLIVSWFGLIFSLFYDPISAVLTDPEHVWSPLQDHALLAITDPAHCVKVQEICLALTPYPIATRVFWGMVIPSAIMIVLVFGHETWRRICPLYFFSQIPRALKQPPWLDIEKNRWLKHNHWYLQFALFFLGLTARILLVNAARPVLGSFFLLTLLAALAIVRIYGGRSWCHYICPFGLVQTIFTGPRGLLDSPAHTAPPRSITQSMCRTVEPDGTTQSACVRCQSPCLDIDSEKAYWESLSQPGRKFVQYGYLGLVMGYFAYYRLYAGNYQYYFSGAWAHEPNSLGNLFKPGFYLFEMAIPIPKLIAAPLTLGLCVALSVFLGTKLEKAYQIWLRRRHSAISSEQALHQVFTMVSFVAFNCFFVYGGRPEINRWPIAAQFLFQSVVAVVSTLWLLRTWGRSRDIYMRESLVDKLRRQLKKLPIGLSRLLEGRTITQLNPDEVYILARTLPGITHAHHLKIYQAVLREALQAGHVSSSNSLQLLEHLRQQLEISNDEHFQVLSELAHDGDILPLLYPTQTAPHQMVKTALREGRSGVEQTHLR